MDDSVQLRLHVELYSGETAVIGPLSLGAEARVAEAGMSVFVGPASPHRITVTPPPGEAIAAIEYAVRAPMGNFEEVVGPDSGRWFMNLQHVTAFWKYGREARSRIDDIKVPLYLFTGRDRAVELAARHRGAAGGDRPAPARTGVQPRPQRAHRRGRGGDPARDGRLPARSAERRRGRLGDRTPLPAHPRAAPDRAERGRAAGGRTVVGERPARLLRPHPPPAR